MEWNRLIDLKSINNIVFLMGGTIRYLPYLRVPDDLAYKLIACVYHQYGNTVRHRLKDPSNNIFLFFRWIVETLEQRWLEVSLDTVLFIYFRCTC
jgi:hypothetical protein